MRSTIAAFVCFNALLISVSGGVPVNNPPFWVQKMPGTSPAARGDHAMAYDAAHGQVVLFGGSNGSSSRSDTWVWDGTNWTQKMPATSPPARVRHAMAYDAAHGQVILFGGTGGMNFLSDTWVWDGTNWTQKMQANGPTARQAAAMAYDAANGQVVLFGGSNDTDIFSDTWVWNGTNWTQKMPANSPPARREHAMAYDAAHGQVVLFGGSSPSILSDTWVWDGTNWTQKMPANSPTARVSHAMAYDAAHGQVVLFGGFTGTFRSDTWVWDGTNWMQKMPANSPTARDSHAIAYDAAHDQVVLFGGAPTGITVLSDTWVWTHGIFASAGNPQSTAISSAFSFPLEVTVVDSTGAYVNGAMVTFAGPAGMVSFPGGATAMTGSDGRAHVTAMATATAGSYLVTASLTGGDFTEFLLSNVNTANATGPCQVTTAIDGNQAGSLRSQVATCGKGGTIIFTDAAPNAVITQLQDIQLTQDLTIDGGAGATIDANHLSRIFFQFGGTVTLKHLTLQNGNAKGGDGGDGFGGGGGAAGMGGGLFLNGGTLTLANVGFLGNQAYGGNGGQPNGLTSPMGAFSAGSSGGGGIGGDGGTQNSQIGNGGGGGDFGSNGGSGGDGSGGGPGSLFTTVGGGFGGGGANFGHGGFGGGGGGGDASGIGSVEGGDFGGLGGNRAGTGGGGGGGGGLGGAIFARTGVLVLDSVSFASNLATKGFAGDDISGDGQGKGGALFIMNDATAIYFGSMPTYMGNMATDAGMNTACSDVVGMNAIDNNNICGILTQATISASGGSGQSTGINTAFMNPLQATVSPAIAGIPIVFAGPTSGASTNPANNPATTNASGVASTPVTANSTPGGPYTVTATIGGVNTSATYSLTNIPTVQVMVQTSPIGRSFTVDNTTYTSTQTFTWTVGTMHSIATTSPQPGTTGVQYVFTGWSDSGAISHMVTAASSVTSYTASFKTQYLLTANVNPANTGIVTGGGMYYDSGANAPITATANPGYVFANWTGPVASSTSAATTVSMTQPQTVTANFARNVTSQMSVTQTGFGRNRATGIWSATLTVTNTGAAVAGPVQVVLKNLTPGVTMQNNNGTRNGDPYITVTNGSLAAGASVSVTIQFLNPSNGYINFTPEVDSGF